MATPIARFYQKCNPLEPLPFGDPRYEEFTDLRGLGDLAERMANAVRLSDHPLHLLFSGHRGSGKSTELERLRHRLVNPEPGEHRFFVVYFEADHEDVDVNDVDFPDVLLAILRHVARDLRVQLGIRLGLSWFQRFVGDLKRLLVSEVEFDKLEFDAKITKITATIKASPDLRHELRRSLEPHISNLLWEANNLLGDAVTQLRLRGYEDLVLIVDNLDRIVLRDLPDSDFNLQEQLFVNRGAQMAALNCHAIYTVPISLVFSPRAPALSTIYGRQAEILPLVKVCDPEGNEHEDGILAMEQMVGKRLEEAELNASDAFDAGETLRFLCRMSGGHPRNLMILLRSAIEWSGQLPITSTNADRAAQGMRNDFARALARPEYLGVLRQVDRSHQLPGSDHDQLLLSHHSVLEYRNRDQWYAVNPAIRDASWYKKAAGAGKRRGP